MLLKSLGAERLSKLGFWFTKLSGISEDRPFGWDSNLRITERFWASPTVTDGRFFEVSEPVTTLAILSFSAPSTQLDKQTPLVKELFKIQGVKSITITPYQILVQWSAVFGLKEMCPKIHAVLHKHLSV
ncbi:MAG: hypothetical protein WC786_05320 [Patescibacteria group bacterium]